MKKLMLFAAVAGMAVAAQAASIDWGLTNGGSIKHKDGSAFSTAATVYLLNTGATGYADVVKGLADGTVNAGNIASKGAYVTSASTVTTPPPFVGSTGSAKKTYSDTSITAGQVYDLAFVVFDKVGDDSYYYLSGTSQASGYDGSGEYPQASAKSATWMAATYSASNWKTVTSGGDVPEPTSGLLLLVGAGMLALRRKQK